MLHVATPLEVAGGTIMAAGAALLPDLDHHKGTATHSWGPITRALGGLIGAIAGGHRKATHWLLTAPVAAVGTHFALLAGQWIAVAVVALLVGLALIAWEDLIPGKWEKLWPLNLAASAGIAMLAVQNLDLTWLPWAVGIGWVAHILGDLVTDGGTPIFGPLTTRKYKLTKLNTGGAWETAVGFLLVAGIGALAVLTVMAWPETWLDELATHVYQREPVSTHVNHLLACLPCVTCTSPTL